MTELEQLRADLATIQEAAEIAKIRGFHELAGNYDQVEGELKQKIAKLEAQQELIDPWKRAKEALYHWDQNDREPDYITKRSIFAYVQNLQAKVDELNHELRCERIDGGKVRDDRKAFTAEKNREKLAELTTIMNAIPPACGIFFYSERFRETLELAKELVEKRIEGVKRELQNKAETEFTPGPWYLHKAFVRPGMGNVRGMWVRRVLGENEDQWKDSRIALATGRADENLSVVVAIGNLIAAAPELYQALEKAVESYGRTGGPWNVPSEPGTWLAMAQAALAKARGEENDS